jgi:hypothetical protein
MVQYCWIAEINAYERGVRRYVGTGHSSAFLISSCIVLVVRSYALFGMISSKTFNQFTDKLHN